MIFGDTGSGILYPSKHETFNHSGYNVGPASKTMGQHCTNNGWTSRICWDCAKNTTLTLSFRRAKANNSNCPLFTSQLLLFFLSGFCCWLLDRNKNKHENVPSAGPMLAKKWYRDLCSMAKTLRRDYVFFFLFCVVFWTLCVIYLYVIFYMTIWCA